MGIFAVYEIHKLVRKSRAIYAIPSVSITPRDEETVLESKGDMMHLLKLG